MKTIESTLKPQPFIRSVFLQLVLAMTMVLVFTGLTRAGAVSVIDKETLKSWMDKGSVTVLNARQGRDWSSSEFKIKGAKRTAPNEYSTWKDQFDKGEKLVLYCA